MIIVLCNSNYLFSAPTNLFYHDSLLNWHQNYYTIAPKLSVHDFNHPLIYEIQAISILIFYIFFFCLLPINSYFISTCSECSHSSAIAAPKVLSVTFSGLLHRLRVCTLWSVVERWSKRSLSSCGRTSLQRRRWILSRRLHFVLNYPRETRLLHLQAQNSLWLYSASLPSSLKIWTNAIGCWCLIPLVVWSNLFRDMQSPNAPLPTIWRMGEGSWGYGRAVVDKQFNTEVMW